MAENKARASTGRFLPGHRFSVRNAGGGSEMARAVAVALSARLKCSLEEAFGLLMNGQTGK